MPIQRHLGIHAHADIVLHDDGARRARAAAAAAAAAAAVATAVGLCHREQRARGSDMARQARICEAHLPAVEQRHLSALDILQQRYETAPRVAAPPA